MPKLKVEVPHQLGRQEAKSRLLRFSEKVYERYKDQVENIEESWDEDVLTFGFTTFGFRIQGKLYVEETAVKVETNLPLPALMMKGRIEKDIREELQKALAD